MNTVSKHSKKSKDLYIFIYAINLKLQFIALSRDYRTVIIMSF